MLSRIISRCFSSHSFPTEVKNVFMKVKILPALEDNYMYLIIDDHTRHAAVVDPVDPMKVLLAVEEEECHLTSILTTHHHVDHAGGNEQMLKLKGDLKVYGYDKRIYGITDRVKDNHWFILGSLKVYPLLTPCHTKGHVCYYIENKYNPALFSGDTLFLGGCGKFFEGSGVDMYHSLIRVLSKLPDQTSIYCWHEYSISNLEYAQYVDPFNEAAKAKLKWAKTQRQRGMPCMPFLMKEEKSYNPFMRVDDVLLQRRCSTSSGVATMDYLRNEKDHFRKYS